MKKILLSFVLIASFGWYARLNAQSCTVNQPTITLNTASTDGSGNCVLDFDITFDLPNSNGGNKIQNVHIWTEAAYATLPANLYGSSNNTPPSVADLDAAPTLATLTIDRDITTTQCYNRNGSGGCLASQPTSLETGKTVIKSINGSTTTYTIKHVIVTVSGGCSNGVFLRADVWSSQSSSNNSVSCLNRGYRFAVNDPQLSGFKDCATPRMIHFGVITVGTVPADFTYQIYKDNGNGSFDPGDANVTLTNPNDDIIHITTAGAGGQVSRVVGFTGNGATGESSDYWVVVTPVGATYSVAKLLSNSCFPLPVKLTYFNAKRSNASGVSLTWQTAQEINASGFEIQRQIGNGTWQVVGFVPTQAPDGNSSSLLNYSFNDNNNARAITQYRLRAIDFDANSKFSEIRAVRGEGQAGKIIVYPNPSFDGRTKIVFEDVSGTRDVSITDISGRMIKQWTGITNNNLEVDNLTPGFYSLRVVVRETGELSIEKIVVSKR